MDQDTPRLETATIPRLEGIAALSAALGMSVCLASLDAIDSEADPFTRAGLFTAIVVHYARSFEQVRDEEEGISRSFRKRGVPGFEKSVHESLLHLRDKYIAHVGHEANDYEVSYIQVMGSADLCFAGERVSGLEAQVGMGSRARASFPTNVDPLDRTVCRTHLHAVQQAALDSLLESLKCHQAVIEHRVKTTGTASHPAFANAPPRPLGVRTTPDHLQSGEVLLQFCDDDLHISNPAPLAEMRLIFASVHYQIVRNADGDLVLERAVRG